MFKKLSRDMKTVGGKKDPNGTCEHKDYNV